MKARKRFGQHFLQDTRILQQMLIAIQPKQNDHLVEIGPGHGALTEYLIGKSSHFNLIEIDRDLIMILQEKFKEHATIFEGDVLNFDFKQLEGDALRIVGNLPYNISTPLLFHLFDSIDLIKDMHFLLQKEVVDRLTAKIGTNDYNRLSVMTQYYCDNDMLFTVGPEAFDPPPKVQSAFVRLQPKKRHTIAKDIKSFNRIVREAFTYRRKTLSNCLKKLITADQLKALDIDPSLRPQQLSVEDYIRISNLMDKSKIATTNKKA